MACRSARLSALAAALATLSPADAVSQTFDVKLLDVKQGSVELGFDNTLHAGLPGSSANRSAHDQSIDYGLFDWWRLSGVLKVENPSDTDIRLGRVAVENLFVLKPVSKTRDADIGIGWFTAVEASADTATTNSVIFGPIVTFKLGALSFTGNPFLDQTFGRNRLEGIALSYGWQAKYELRGGLAIGVEGFGVVENLGNSLPWSEQEHRIGPAIFAEIELWPGVTITPDVGLLFGLTPATPDLTLKLNVGVPLQHRP